MITVRVLVAVFPQVSVATQSMVSVATCVGSMTKAPGEELGSEKIAQPGEFDNMRRRQNRAD